MKAYQYFGYGVELQGAHSTIVDINDLFVVGSFTAKMPKSICADLEYFVVKAVLSGLCIMNKGMECRSSWRHGDGHTVDFHR